MQAIRIHQIVERDGEISLKGLPYKKGQRIEMIVMAESLKKSSPQARKAKDLLNSGLVGIWQDRNIEDSAAFARELRQNTKNYCGGSNGSM
jgi:hypothetical protein